jgi:cytochrome c-type biogenesis protein CcmH/NrfG
LAPWLPLPAESAAYTALRLATGDGDPSRRVALLREGEALLTRARDHAVGGPGSWALTGQIALAEARMGEPGQLTVSRDAFATALRLRPGDPRLLAQAAWVWLESGDTLRARQTAEQALAREPREWMAWAVLARVSKTMGDAAGAAHATGRVRDLSPPEARARLDALLR